jgi:hypothetical protein
MEAWYDALCAIADHSPMAYWQMSNGAEFWWMPGRSQLGPDRFTREPFSYAEIVSVTVFDTVPIKPGGWACDFEALRARLTGVTGL